MSQVVRSTRPQSVATGASVEMDCLLTITKSGCYNIAYNVLAIPNLGTTVTTQLVANYHGVSTILSTNLATSSTSFTATGITTTAVGPQNLTIQPIFVTLNVGNASGSVPLGGSINTIATLLDGTGMFIGQITLTLTRDLADNLTFSTTGGVFGNYTIAPNSASGSGLGTLVLPVQITNTATGQTANLFVVSTAGTNGGATQDLIIPIQSLIAVNQVNAISLGPATAPVTGTSFTLPVTVINGPNSTTFNVPGTLTGTTTTGPAFVHGWVRTYLRRGTRLSIVSATPGILTLPAPEIYDHRANAQIKVKLQ